MRLLVTGANGFVGMPLCAELIRQNHSVVSAVRSVKFSDEGFHSVVIGDINDRIDWSGALDSVEIVIHLAARVHVMNDSAEDNLTDFRKVNVDGTLNLARQAARFGVKRFVFVSSVKVNGEVNKKNKPFRADDNPNPQDPYGISKCEGEAGLIQLSKETGMEVVIIRPPLVYGPGVKANFLNMIKILDKGIPLPLRSVSNKRSLVFVGNLVDLLIRVTDHPKAAGHVFLVSDDHDVSTATLLKSMSSALGKKAKLIPVPLFLLKAIFYIIVKASHSQRLLESLSLDISKTKELLSWTPPISFEEGIARTARSFLNSKS